LARSLDKTLAPFRAVIPAPAAKSSAKASSKSAKSARAGDPSVAVDATPDPYDTRAALARLSGWMEPRHTLLLRTLLDRTEVVRTGPAPAIARGVHRVLDELARDTKLKYAEFRERWESRLAPAALLPFLNRNQWIVPYSGGEEGEANAGGYVLSGKSGRQEARMLYLQTGHDMATDCARQWASIGGRLQAFEASFASEWHAAVVNGPDDATRLLPALEATLRGAEFDAWKKLRLSLGELAEEAFIQASLRWETRVFPDHEALVLGTLAPWVRYSPSGNGWSGLMRCLSHVAEAMTLAMLEHYGRKWDLYLRGLGENEK
jgi:hypothetical protein